MVERLTSRIWIMQTVYVGLSLAIIYARLLPLQNHVMPWAAPNLLVIMTFAWALRRPDYVPAISVAIVMLMADLLLLRPPGLMAALVLISTAALQRRQRDIREMGFPLEWLTVTIALGVILVAERLVLGLFMVPQVSLGQSVIQSFATALYYPVVVLGCELIGVRRIAPGEVSKVVQRT
jgi:rod shape-determining protein MreD